MKKFEPGDRVSFINEKQDGVITRILPNGNCMVEIEDGFEIETTPGELVKIIVAQKRENKLSEPSKKEEILSIPEVAELRKLLPGLVDCVTLVLLPSDNNKVLTGPVKYFLINESKYDVLYTFSKRSGRKLFGIASGKVTPANEVYLGELNRDVLMEAESLFIQMLFHNQNVFQQVSVITKELPVEYPDLNHVNKNISGVAAFSKSFTLISFMETPVEDLSELVRKYQADQPASLAKQDTSQNFLNKAPEHFSNYNVAPGFMEVDLHIEELVEDASGLTNTEMISIQLQHFRKAIDDALLRKAHKITFIHGIGNGRLKNALRTEIQNISYLSFRDAPYEKYGAGATEVLLK